MNSVDGSALAQLASSGRTDIERRTWEFGTRSAIDNGAPGRSSITWVLQSFTRFSDEETHTTARGGADTASRRSDVETQSTGMMALAEPEAWISPSVALVGRAGIGVYYYDVEGDFRSKSSLVPDPFAAKVSDDDDGFGFRAALGAGVKVRVTDTTMLTGFAEADYLSDVGAAKLPDNNFFTTAPARVSTDDAWDFKAGARISIGVGN